MIKRAAIAVLFAGLVGVGLAAIENSVTFGPLKQSPQFRSRVTFIITQQAPVILTEATTGAYTAECHTKRASLAAAVAANPDAYAGIFAAHLATNINVVNGGALTGTLTAGTLDTPATDAALLAAVASVWSTVSGCISNP